MGKVNACLKRGFFIFTGLFGVISVLLLAYTLFTHHGYHSAGEMDELEVIFGISIFYALGIIALLLSILGLYGVCKDKKWALVLFTVVMALISFIWFVLLTILLAERHQFDEHFKRALEDMMPLSEASQAELDPWQQNFRCCGLVRGYEDWGYDIPTSCNCTEGDLSQCVVAPKNSSLSQQGTYHQPIMIYKEPCLPILISTVALGYNITIAILLGIMLLWMVPTGLGVVILCQMRRNADVPTVVYSKEANEGNYTKLIEATDTA